MRADCQSNEATVAIRKTETLDADNNNNDDTHYSIRQKSKYNTTL